MKTVLSVDVAKSKSMFMLMNSDGEILIDSIEVKHNFEGFEKIRKQVETFNINDLTVFMESTGIYHLPVERYFKIINSFYGIGEVLAAELLGELGDITRFDNHKQLIAFCGLDPTIIQSGKSINVHGAISKRGDKYVRWILFNISQMVVKLGHQCPNHPVYNYYLKKKAEGKHYYESLTACSTKILRMLYSMCKNNTTFLND